MPQTSRPDSLSVWGPERSWWVFNPGPRLDICLSEGVFDFVFHQKTFQFKPNMAISPQRHLTLLGDGFPWRAMLIDYHESLALLYTHERGWGAPAGVFPMWSANNPTSSLIKILDTYPDPGEEVGWFTGAKGPSHAVEGQEQMVVICNFPKNPTAWEGLFRDLIEVKRNYPHYTFHLNGQKSIPRTLATGVDSFDHPVTIDWIGEQPRLLLANGSLLDHKTYQKQGEEYRKWARLVGIDVGQIFNQPDRVRKSRKMYTFNLRSLKWSFANYDRVWSMRVVDETDVNTDEPDMTWIPVDLRYRPRSKVTTDKWVCDLCSISDRCPFYRPGAICAVDDTEAAELSAKFKTRSSRDIVDALGSLLAAQTNRAGRAMAAEAQHNEDHPDEQKFSPEVTRMLASTFDQGVTLARLVDPNVGVPNARGRGGKANVIDVTASSVGDMDPQQLAAGFMAELEAGGQDISSMTPSEAQEFLARLIPSGTMPPHVDDDHPGAERSERDPVVEAAPSFRAAPRLDP